jgi:hypothetical protein
MTWYFDGIFQWYFPKRIQGSSKIIEQIIQRFSLSSHKSSTDGIEHHGFLSNKSSNKSSNHLIKMFYGSSFLSNDSNVLWISMGWNLEASEAPVPTNGPQHLVSGQFPKLLPQGL